MVLIIWICWEDIKMLWVKGLSSFTCLLTCARACLWAGVCMWGPEEEAVCPPQSLSIHSFEQGLSRNLELEPLQLVGLEISKPLWSACLHPPRSWGYRHFTGMPDLSFGMSSTPHSCEAGLFPSCPSPQPYTFLTIWKERQNLTQMIESM